MDPCLDFLSTCNRSTTYSILSRVSSALALNDCFGDDTRYSMRLTYYKLSFLLITFPGSKLLNKLHSLIKPLPRKI